MLKQLIEDIYKYLGMDELNIVSFYRARHVWLLCKLMETQPGNIVEIGCYSGELTRIYGTIARRFDQKVFAVDPFDGTQGGKEEILERFLFNINEYANVISFKRLDSRSVDGMKTIRESGAAFVFVDGYHTGDNARSDSLCAMDAGAKIICIDDVRFGSYSEKLMNAVNNAVEIHGGYEHIVSPDNFRETYLIKKDLQ